VFLLRKTISLVFIFAFSCNDITIEKQLPMNWSKFDLDLPDGIDVYQGQNFKLPLRAWVAKVDLNNKKISAKVLSSNDRDRKETPLQFLESTGAIVVINGGFFNSDNFISKHVGLLKTNGLLEEPASHSVIRDSERYYITRGAFGINFDGNPDISWCSTKNDSIFGWKRPINNRPGFPSKKLKFNNAYLWNVRDAIHAGPVLIDKEKIKITVEDEVFFNTPIAGIQPRSAIGYTTQNELILMVVDGRQSDSRGVYLEELALLMSQFNCVEALNLDGGGSSALIADSRLLNRPLGRTSQREVMSAVGIFYNK
tara:strand:- start:145 stop:1077 length:933 start_codon:yes stop_codon:yes gene_type:complete